MPSEHRLIRQVEFAETDMAGIMHFSNFFRYMEACETDLFRSLSLTQISLSPEHAFGWPRVRAHCEYHAPLRFNDRVAVCLYVKEIKDRALHFVFRFRKETAGGDPLLVASGELAVVCAELDPRTGALRSRPIPDDVRAALTVAAPEAYRR